MTIIEAINRIDNIKPNTYSQEEKVQWLSTLDGTIKKEVIDTHEGAEAVPFQGYTANTPLNTVLLVPAPYDQIYIAYLEMQIDYANAEYGKYSNSMSMYNQAFAAFERYYNRENKPISRGKRFLF